MRKSYLFYLLLLMGIFHMNTYAQSNPVTATVTIGPLPTVLDLQITANTATSVNFNTPTALDNGITLLNATILTYSSNEAYFITINSSTANFSGGSSPAMPASVVQYRLNGGSTYTALSSTAVSLKGAQGSEVIRGTGTYGIDFFINPGYTYPPASDYSITIDYTISNL